MSKSRYEGSKVLIMLLTIVYLRIRLNFLRVAVKVFPNSQKLLGDLQSTRERLAPL